MVRRFILRCLLLGLPAVGLLALYAISGARWFPAPRITPNLSVNEKLAFAKSRFAQGVDVLALGSSMTLNNLNSAAVMQHFGQVRYLNAGGWGIGAAGLSMLGPVLVDRLDPRLVIVSTNLMDFTAQPDMLAGSGKAMDRSFTEPQWLGYLRHWDIPYYLREMELNKVRFTDSGNYEYLRFDEHGGAPLDIPKYRINPARYGLLPPTSKDISEKRYADFGRFVQYLHRKGVRLAVFESAYRDGVRTAASDSLDRAHVARLRAMLRPGEDVLVDAGQRHWPDSLFVDSSHFGPAGSMAYTRYCLGEANIHP